ncbi:helix-turn-helix domain-containing protein [Singulisphaera sp. PoT]|uniref:AraC family transcriptional regulator n=1 Tax=Singulisphaera sp. PoT TaxID=3411797 RepID=UPI003BF53CF2
MATRLAPGTFFGQTQSKIQVAGLTFDESVYAAGHDLYLPPHAHEDAFLHLMVEGICEESYGRVKKVREAASLGFHPEGEPHSNRWHESGGRVFHIDISKARADMIREHAPSLDRPAELMTGVAPWLARRLYREYRRPDGASPLALEGLALEVLAETSRGPAIPHDLTPPRWLVRVRDLLHDRFADDVSFDEIAAEVGVHPVHLARSFRRHHGCTPGEYLRKLRVEHACRTLATTGTPLIEVALASGFSDQSHFTRTFRMQMGMTPGEFRRIFRGR